jgi:hypothetical protein
VTYTETRHQERERSINKTSFLIRLTSSGQITPEMKELLAQKIQLLPQRADEDHDLVSAAAHEAFEGQAGGVPLEIAFHTEKIEVEGIQTT